MKKDRYFGSPEYLIEKQEILEKFHFKCVRCGKTTNIVHEMETRASCGKDSFRLENRCPLCSTCHDWAHSIGIRVSRPLLVKLRQKALEKYAN